MRTTRSTLLALALAAGLAAPAAATGLHAEQTVERVIETTDEAGNVTVAYLPADRVAPGDTVIYRLTYRNDGAELAEDVRLVMPVPPEVRYIENSAMAGAAQLAFSADGGETFLGRADLQILLDGTPRPAMAGDITHIRWHFEAGIAPGEDGEVSFRGILQ